MASWTLNRARTRCWKPAPTIITEIAERGPELKGLTRCGYLLTKDDAGLVKVTRTSDAKVVAIAEWNAQDFHVVGLDYFDKTDQPVIDALVLEFEHLQRKGSQ